MVNYERAIKRPFGDLKTLLIGVILAIIPVVNLLALGFKINCAKTALNNDYKLPVWGDWAKLFISGLVAAIISMIYMVPGIAVLLATVGVTLLGMLSGTQSSPDVVGLIMFLLFGSMSVGTLVAIALFILAAYLLPAAILGYVKNDDFGAAFKLKEIMNKTMRAKYLLVWVLMAAYMCFLGAVLSAIPLVGSAFASFITGVTAMTAFAEVYNEK